MKLLFPDRIKIERPEFAWEIREGTWPLLGEDAIR